MVEPTTETTYEACRACGGRLFRKISYLRVCGQWTQTNPLSFGRPMTSSTSSVLTATFITWLSALQQRRSAPR